MSHSEVRRPACCARRGLLASYGGRLARRAARPAVLLPPPLDLHPNREHSIKPWLDEQIWGHRLWDSQSPWLIFLEFLECGGGVRAAREPASGRSALSPPRPAQKAHVPAQYPFLQR